MVLGGIKSLLEKFEEDICFEHLGFPNDWKISLKKD